MRSVFGFLGTVLVIVGAAAVVAELLHLVVGGSDGTLSLRRLWMGVHGGSLAGLESWVTATIGTLGSTPLGWLLALPSWLVLLVVGLPLFFAGNSGRDRGFG